MSNTPEPVVKIIDGVEVINFKTPPIWDACVMAFQVIPASVIFTYGNRIYNPSGGFIPDHVMAHEKVHIVQQGGTDEGAALWWGKFLRDPAFRLDQESEAYAVQYKFICKKVKDRNQQHRILMDFGRMMSSPMYGNMISMSEGMALIKKRAQ